VNPEGARWLDEHIPPHPGYWRTVWVRPMFEFINDAAEERSWAFTAKAMRWQPGLPVL
jgi:hypothetical protein